MSKPFSTQDRRDLACAISAVEDRTSMAEDLLESAARADRVAHVIGVTGPPGAGKSTLVDRLAVHVAQGGERVAVLAVDPSSPFSGGAVLGDRIRMDGIRRRTTSGRRASSRRHDASGRDLAP